MTFNEWWGKRNCPMDNLYVFNTTKAAWEAATKIEREECANVCRKRAAAMGETIRAANPRTSEHIMIRRDARVEEANDCAAEIMERNAATAKEQPK